MGNRTVRPLYHQIYQRMLANIRGGVWLQGEKIPAEQELCSLYGASRITVRRALQMLVDGGYLERSQGRGTYVRHQVLKPRLPSLYSFLDMASNGTERLESLLLCFEKRPCPEEIAQKLEIPAGTEVFFMERMRFQGKRPFSYSRTYLLCELAPGLTAAEIRQHGLYGAIRALDGAVPDHARETFQAVMMDSRTAKRLNQRGRGAALQVWRIGFLGKRPMECSVAIMRGDSICYEIELN